MMQDNKIKNYITSWNGVFLHSLFFLLLSLPVYAQETLKDRLEKTGGVDGAGYEDISGSEDTYFAEKLGNFIEILLSFLGVVFLVLIIYGGFMWMTAQGNEEQVGKAKKIIVNSVVGTVIVMLAYAITFFVLWATSDSAGFNLD
jgi:hypothetical protein